MFVKLNVAKKKYKEFSQKCGRHYYPELINSIFVALLLESPIATVNGVGTNSFLEVPKLTTDSSTSLFQQLSRNKLVRESRNTNARFPAPWETGELRKVGMETGINGCLYYFGLPVVTKDYRL